MNHIMNCTDDRSPRPYKKWIPVVGRMIDNSFSIKSVMGGKNTSSGYIDKSKKVSAKG